MTKNELLLDMANDCVYFGNRFSLEELEQMRSEAISQCNIEKVKTLIHGFFDSAKAISEEKERVIK